MEKIKLQIEGMNCKSCAALIEEKLKNKPGIIKAKVSYDAKKAIVVFEEDKIPESEILEAIKETGDYKIKKIVQEKEKKEDEEEVQPVIAEIAASETDAFSSLKTLTALVIVSLALNVAVLIAVLR